MVLAPSDGFSGRWHHAEMLRAGIRSDILRDGVRLI